MKKSICICWKFRFLVFRGHFCESCKSRKGWGNESISVCYFMLISSSITQLLILLCSTMGMHVVALCIHPKTRERTMGKPHTILLECFPIHLSIMKICMDYFSATTGLVLLKCNGGFHYKGELCNMFWLNNIHIPV